MKCFFIFKNKTKKGESRSAPELGDKSKSDCAAVSRTTRSLPSPRSITELYREKEDNLRAFSLEELREATNGFNRLLKLGEGGFGSVYKGRIRPINSQGEPVAVAIKKLNKHGLQGHKQWLAEVQFLGVVSHPNLVKLLGYCCENERGIQRMLVYEYMPHKSLEDHLFNPGLPSLPWKTRLDIILGAAEGLAYLHGGMEVQVIYRDFKASNVLLDKDFKPKLSDFGLAREGPTDQRSHVSTSVSNLLYGICDTETSLIAAPWDGLTIDEVVGTYGYAAPEYVETGHLSSHSDVWSFGVVLYEILTGRRTLERNLPAMEQKLLDWVKQFPADSKRFSMIIDPRLRNEYPINAAKKIAKLADSCLKRNPKERPTMSLVVESIKEAIQVSEGFSTSVNRAAESSQGRNRRKEDRVHV